MKRKQRRMVVIGLLVAAVSIATGLILLAFRDNLVFFFGPSEALARHIKVGQKVRLGGLVEIGSVQKSADGLTTKFRITDNVKSIEVSYSGSIPDLFREGQGVVAEGTFDTQKTFTAETILAKHDENYMPKELVESLKKAGEWQRTETTK